MDTMIEIILLLYFPPLAVIFYENEQSSGAIFITIGMIRIGGDTIGQCHILLRLRIVHTLRIDHEATIDRQTRPNAFDEAIGLTA